MDRRKRNGKRNRRTQRLVLDLVMRAKRGGSSVPKSYTPAGAQVVEDWNQALCYTLQAVRELKSAHPCVKERHLK